MMDATFTAVSRLWEQELSQKEIARRLNISESKVRKILITIGAIETDISRMYASGMTVDEIAEKIEVSVKAVNNHIPYQKGIYNAEYPSKNALKIRKCREKEKNK